ncbi:transposase [Limosilactobacillus fermentum]|uniref:transposase n=1 Tax=Limosilactobacillus fermentum TaxID=1613 RepID=UPI003F7FC2DA
MPIFFYRIIQKYDVANIGLWSPSYYMSKLGNMSKEVVEKYINDQKYTETNKKPHKGAQ